MPFTCKKCGEQFDDRSILGKHIHREHKKTKMPDIEQDVSNYGEVKKEEVPIAEDTVKKIIIPIEMAEELKWIAVGMPARLQVFGYRREQGFEVEDVRYKP